MSRNITPLRYPGGKQRITSFVIDIINVNGGYSKYVEPYAGGAGIALELLANGIVDEVHINDKDTAVFAFWNSLLSMPDEFLKLLMDVDISMATWNMQKHIFNNKQEFSEIEVGFSFFFLNRCNRSGILTAGVIGGNDQSGNYKIDARFNRFQLLERLTRIIDLRHRIKVTNMDGADLMIAEFQKCEPV